MLLFHLVLVALLTPSRSNGELPPHIRNQLTFFEDKSQDAELDELFRKSSEDYVILMMPESTPESDGVTQTPDYENLMTTARESLLLKEEEKRTGSAAWKAVVVVAVLLVAIAGCASVAYYMCVWRGGRIHYQPHKVEA